MGRLIAIRGAEPEERYCSVCEKERALGHDDASLIYISFKAEKTEERLSQE